MLNQPQITKLIISNTYLEYVLFEHLKPSSQVSLIIPEFCSVYYEITRKTISWLSFSSSETILDFIYSSCSITILFTQIISEKSLNDTRNALDWSEIRVFYIYLWSHELANMLRNRFYVHFLFMEIDRCAPMFYGCTCLRPEIFTSI